ncbi:hypothetical protein FACS1894198_0030 [Clostridia bacterium]|nr:hypothetical protein FACS1894198_0030 [Clostridia bacterium]
MLKMLTLEPISLSGMEKSKSSFGKLRVKNARPPAAGLKILLPYPPNGCFITSIANAAAMMQKCFGRAAGNKNAIITPVKMEVRSSFLGLAENKSCPKKSNNTQEETDNRKVKMICIPEYITARGRMNKLAKITSRVA